MPQLTSCMILNDETNAVVLLIFTTLAQQHHHVAMHVHWNSQFCRLDVFGRALDGVAVLCGELGDELEQGGTLVFDRLAVAAQQGLVLSCQDVDPCLQLRETVPDVMHQ